MPGIKGGWAVRAEGADRASKTFRTKPEAVRKAQQMARDEKGTLYIHRDDGTVSEKRSFAPGAETALA